MIATPEQHPWTPEEYLAWEVQQELRYEYLDGEVFAMTGGSLPHGDIALNIATRLRELLRGRCNLRRSRLYRTTIFPLSLLNCRSFIPQYEAYDRGGKFSLYRRLTSLQEYVLVSSEAQMVEVFDKRDRGTWIFTPYSEGAIVELTSVNLEMPMSAIYEDDE
ncbi:MAG: Uma2 family endonuclease [Spirulinaceae cyanobacterium]